MDDERISIDKRLIIPGLIGGVIAVMAITVMGVQYLPFMTRTEATADRQMVLEKMAQSDLRLATDEARIQKLEDHYGSIEQELSDLNMNLARYTQQVVDEQRVRDAHDQKGR